MRKKGLPESIVKAVMSLYHVAKMKARARSGIPEDFLVQFDVHPRTCIIAASFCNYSGAILTLLLRRLDISTNFTLLFTAMFRFTP